MAARRKKADEVVLEKAQVTITPPGLGPKFALLGNAKSVFNDIAVHEKKGQMGIFYEMYRQHPVIRSAVDRKANFLSTGGFNIVSSNPQETIAVDKSKSAALMSFFRKSQYRKLLRLTYKDLDIFGESYWVIILSLNGTPMKARRLNARFMTPIIIGGEVVRWRYGPVANDNDAIEYPDELILHFTLEDPESDVTGISPLYALQRSVAQDIFAMEYNESFFKNAAQTGTIFVAKTADAAEAARAREWIEANYTGPENAHRPLFIEGDVSVEKSVSTRVEMEFMEGRKFLRQEIAMVLEVDLEKLGIHENSGRAVSKEQNEAFHSESIRPRQIIIEDEINFKLLETIFGWEDIAVESVEADLRRRREQVDIWDQHQKMGRMTIDDVLNEMGRPALPDGLGSKPMIWTPAGIMPIDMVLKLAEQQMVAEPISGVGTTATGQRNPSNAAPTKQLSPNQADQSKQGDR